MNLVIGFVILLCLLCAEISTPEAVNDWWFRTCLVGLVSLSVPGLALFQTLVVSRRLRETDLPERQSAAIINRLSVCHSAVWLAASLAIIWAVRWQDVVRGNWNLDRWPLVDEAIILAPVILSLVASWAIFFDVQQTVDGETSRWFDPETFRKRCSFVSIRFRIYILMLLVPLSIAILSRDVAPWMNSLNQITAITIYIAVGAAVMAGFPFLLLLIWRTENVKDDQLRTELINECTSHQLHVHDVRVWKTGGRIVNALVAGVIPKFRIILLSDSLLKFFPKHELMAIVRHEAGHLRLWHLPIRIGFIALPLIALASDERNPLGLVNGLEILLSRLGLPVGTGFVLIIAIYLGYLLLSLSWLSHRMEYEADIYACQSKTDSQSTIDPNLAQDVSDALLRLASITPSQFERRSIMHPSIQQRLLLVRDIVDSPHKADKFQVAFRRRRSLVLLALGLLCAATLLT